MKTKILFLLFGEIAKPPTRVGLVCLTLLYFQFVVIELSVITKLIFMSYLFIFLSIVINEDCSLYYYI